VRRKLGYGFENNYKRVKGVNGVKNQVRRGRKGIGMVCRERGELDVRPVLEKSCCWNTGRQHGRANESGHKNLPSLQKERGGGKDALGEHYTREFLREGFILGVTHQRDNLLN